MLVKKRSINAYSEIAQLLADLREALSSGDQSNLAERQAKKLNDTNPKLHHLTAALRNQGFLRKG